MNDIDKKISELYDGELDHDEIEGLLEIISADPELQKKLSMYSLAGIAFEQWCRPIKSDSIPARQSQGPDSLKGMTEVLSSLARQEALFVGEGAILPARIRIRDLDQSQLPKSEDISFGEGWQTDYPDQSKISEIAKRMKCETS